MVPPLPNGIQRFRTFKFYKRYITPDRVYCKEEFKKNVIAYFLIAPRPFTGKWFDLYGENSIIYPCILLFASGIWLLSLVTSGWMLLLEGGIIGLGFGTLLSSFQSIAVQAAPLRRAGVATATSFKDSQIYFVCFIIVLLSSFLYFLLQGKKVRPV